MSRIITGGEVHVIRLEFKVWYSWRYYKAISAFIAVSETLVIILNLCLPVRLRIAEVIYDEGMKFIIDYEEPTTLSRFPATVEIFYTWNFFFF